MKSRLGFFPTPLTLPCRIFIGYPNFAPRPTSLNVYLAEAFSQSLGNRSNLKRIIDQYRAKTDCRSDIVNDPNRPDDPQYILRLIDKVVTGSLERVKIAEASPELGAAEAREGVEENYGLV